ncbi:MAG: hypothetical protein MI974_05020 [Chitinophagales bacterium]|nr:hypothetical protein [Chitinophagales bacterium]
MIDIKEMVLQIPEMGKEEGQRLAQEVSQKLTALLPADFEPQTIDAINLKLDYPNGASRSQLSTLIATSIWKNIRQKL